MATENENKNQEQPEEPTPPAGEQSDGERRVPESALKKQAADFQAQLAEMQAKIDGYEKAAADKEQKKLEEQNEYKTLWEKSEAERKTENAANKAEFRRLQLEAKLSGIRVDDDPEINQATIDGLIEKCPADIEPDVYAADLREKKPHLWQAPSAQGTLPAQGGRAAGGSNQSLKERAASGDKAAMTEYFNKLGEQQE